MKPSDEVVHEVLVQWPKGHRTWMSVPAPGMSPDLPPGCVVIEGRSRLADAKHLPDRNPNVHLEPHP